ncbi:uncharacterized protein LOC127110447 [Lathyrus oleraceus]|uniref:uncharacterized protein LOC127110447 n=1 Tax=Pisum sativum TaxID=3888 RepID=UPI0021D2BF84|nr:uncharacterized protein LOC127110447 [Pisum sativum]
MPCSPSAEPSNPNREDPVADSVNTPHVRRPKETVSGFSSSIVLEEQTKEDSRYVHNAIATIVTGILSGNLEESNVDIPLDNVAGEEVHVTHDVSDNPNCEAETVNLEEFFDNELLSSVLPSIAKRVRTMREKKTVAQRSPRKKIDVPTSSKTTVAVESSLKRKVHGPTKSWSKVVPKKKKIKWKYVYQKRLALERELAQNVLDCKDIMDLIQEAEYDDGKSKEFRKVYVRGKCVNFSPSVINKYLGRPDEAQPELEVRKWPLKGKLVASKLSVKYAMLHKIGVANWVPTNHKSIVVVMLGKFIYAVGTKAKFDYGSYIFDQTLKHAGSFSVKGPIAFPSLICGETSRVSNQPGKAVVIAMLKETCRELEARKLNLENLISSLEMTEGDVLADGGEFGEAVAVVEEAERQGEEGEADASPDDGTDDDADSKSDD